MTFNNLSIKYKILLLPLITLFLLVALESSDYYLKKRLNMIAEENDICHQISLLLSEILHLESDFTDTGYEYLLQDINKKNSLVRESLQQSRLIVPTYRDPVSGLSIASILDQHNHEFAKVAELQREIDKTNLEILAIYNDRNWLVQAKTDEIVRHEYELLLTTGETINNAKKEFANTLRELTSLDAIATLNTTELYHLGDEDLFLTKEEAYKERGQQIVSAADALSVVTEDDTDRDAWLEILSRFNKVNSLRDHLYAMWKERQEISSSLPITDKALTHFSSFMLQRMQEERASATRSHDTYHLITLSLAILLIGLVSFFVLRSILVPVTKLKDGTKLLRDGAVDITVDVTTKDELGELAATFNDMIQARKVMLNNLEDSERKFRQLLESTSTIPWELDLISRKFTYIGKQAEDILGYPLSAWKDFDSWADKIHPDDREYAITFCMSKAEQIEDHEFTYRAIHQDGSVMHIQDIVSVIAENGKAVKLVGFMHDITEKKLAGEERESLEQQLQQAQKMEAIGTLAGGIAHDFNNLLGVIFGYAEMVKDDLPRGSALIEDMDKILEASYRARDLVQQILAFSRQSSTELQLFQPASITKEAVKMLRSSIPTTVTIQEKINPNCEAIQADPTQFHQIIMNLCTNAYHALEVTGGILAVSLDNVTITAEDVLQKLHYKHGEFVRLIIADNGPGIDPAIAEKIFDPFFTTKEVGKGTGMGLSIVHGIVTSYGGMINFESIPHEGTTFYVYFPVAKKDFTETEETEETLPKGQERILLIDDEELLATMTGDMLTRLGYDVTVRHSSLEALQTFENQPHHFDLVITDQTMPGMTGETLARRILQIRPEMPIILCTGFSNVISEDKAKSIGIRKFCLKPLIKKDISKLLREVLEESPPS